MVRSHATASNAFHLTLLIPRFVPGSERYYLQSVEKSRFDVLPPRRLSHTYSASCGSFHAGLHAPVSLRRASYCRTGCRHWSGSATGGGNPKQQLVAEF